MAGLTIYSPLAQRESRECCSMHEGSSKAATGPFSGLRTHAGIWHTILAVPHATENYSCEWPWQEIAAEDYLFKRPHK